MADTHEEQLLSDLLVGIAREDAGLGAPHLETRVLESARDGADAVARRSALWLALPVIAALLLAVAVTVRPAPERPAGNLTGAASSPVEESIPWKPPTADGPRQASAEQPPGPRRTAARPRTAEPAERHEALEAAVEMPASVETPPAADSSLDQAPIEFVPLTPLAEWELTGSFQIVRVQMPSASLGVLRPPLEPPNRLVEADVLLGEDGRARAIRLNTNGSIYPWRPR